MQRALVLGARHKCGSEHSGRSPTATLQYPDGDIVAVRRGTKSGLVVVRRHGRNRRRAGRLGWHIPRKRRTVAACAEASRPSVARAKRRRRANWRPPPASTSASSAAIASRVPVTRRHSRLQSLRSRTRLAHLVESIGVPVEEGPNRWTPGSGQARTRPRVGVTDPAEATSPATSAPWWVRPGLDIDDGGRLRIAGVGRRRRSPVSTARRSSSTTDRASRSTRGGSRRRSPRPASRFGCASP